MQKRAKISFFCGLAASAAVRADETTRERLIRYFGGWYSDLPGSSVSAAETREVLLPDLETYSESKIQESNVAFYDRGRHEVFVGDVFHDSGRAAPSFIEGATFLFGEHPLLETCLTEKFPATTRHAAPGGRP